MLFFIILSSTIIITIINIIEPLTKVNVSKKNIGQLVEIG